MIGKESLKRWWILTSFKNWAVWAQALFWKVVGDRFYSSIIPSRRSLPKVSKVMESCKWNQWSEISEVKSCEVNLEWNPWSWAFRMSAKQARLKCLQQLHVCQGSSSSSEHYYWGRLKVMMTSKALFDTYVLHSICRAIRSFFCGFGKSWPVVYYQSTYFKVYLSHVTYVFTYY